LSPPVEPSSTVAESPRSVALLLLAIAVGLVLTGLRIAFDQFDTDELQHAHVAWLMANGEVPYRDFWEHHGPVYSLLNAALIALAGMAPGMDLLFSLRAVNGALGAGLLLLTFRLAGAAGATRAGSMTAVALLAAAYFFQNVVAELRPDALQNLCWLAGLLLVTRQLARPSGMTALGAGALFGLAVVTNTKAILGPVFIAIFYGLAAVRGWLPLRRAIGDLSLFAAGALLPLAAILAWFWRQDALDPFLRMTTLWNLAALGIDRNMPLAAANAGFMLTRQLPFILAIAIGAWLVLRPTGQATNPAGQARVLVLVAGLGTAALWIVNDFYPQYLLICLPLLAVTAGPGLIELGAIAGRALRWQEPRALLVVAGLSLFYMLGMAAARTPLAEHPNLARQRELTGFMLANTGRDEPVGVFFSSCAGYVFNRNLGYWWAADADIGLVTEWQTGANPFGPALVADLEESGVKYLVGRPEVVARLPYGTRDYIDARFSYEDCLWTRR
jgi:hypothetical protein